MSADKKNPFKTHKQALVTATDEKVFSRWKLVVIKGDSDFLISQTTKRLRELWSGFGWSVERLDGSSVNHEVFFQATTATSIFEPRLVTLVYDAQCSQDLQSILTQIKAASDIQNPIVLIWRGKDLNAKIQRELTRIGPLWIPCEEPAPWEVKEFAQDYCKSQGLKLNSQALDLFLGATGSSLFRIANEIEKLSLVFHETQKTLVCEDIYQHLDYLKEEHIFKLDQLLCQESFEKAHLLIRDLIERGENPLGLLAILAMHCRKALQVKAALKRGLNSAEISKSLRLPQTIIQLYVAYVQKRRQSVFNRALSQCHELDKKFKSRKFDEEIGLSSVIFELAQP